MVGNEGIELLVYVRGGLCDGLGYITVWSDVGLTAVCDRLTHILQPAIQYSHMCARSTLHTATVVGVSIC